MAKTALIFPGQGSQLVGMGKDLAEQCPEARQLFEQADALLGFDLSAACFDGPEERIERTDIQQPAIFAVSGAVWRALQVLGVDKSHVQGVAGLSLGEYTALHVAGALSFDDGLKLVAERGRLMQEAATAVPSGMVSLIGADAESAQALCDRAAQGQVLVPANFNCPGQVVISGEKDACQRAEALAEEFGLRAVALKVAGAFHSPLMAPAAERLAARLADASIEQPGLPVIANVTAERHTDAASVRELLTRQLTHPVRWAPSMERMLADGYDRFYEIGPGRVLCGLMRKIQRRANCKPVGSWDDVKQAAEEMVTG